MAVSNRNCWLVIFILIMVYDMVNHFKACVTELMIFSDFLRNTYVSCFSVLKFEAEYGAWNV